MKYLFYITIIFLTLSSCTRKTVQVEEKISNQDLYIEEGIRVFGKGNLAPDFTLKNLKGDSISLSDYKGKAVFINFWAKWCGPCVQEMPSIDRLNRVVSGDEIAVITINIGEDGDVVENFMKDNNLNLEVLLDSYKSVASKYGVRSIPSTFIIDKSGRITGTKIGAHEWDSEGVVNILKGLATE